MANKKFEEAVMGRKIPILILDNMWHRLIKEVGDSKAIIKTQEKLQELVKQQGKLTSELKEMKKLKTNLMDEIVNNMNGAEGGSDPLAAKKVDESKRLINEINEKVEEYNEKLTELPYDIKEVNAELMLLTMERCYTKIKDYTQEIDKIGDWISEMRVELKKNVLKKQHMELVNVELYSYMQGIFGPEVVDLFDIEYDIEASRKAILNRQEAIREEKARKMAKAISEGKEEKPPEAGQENAGSQE